MPTFHYRARSQGGELLTGAIETSGPEAAADHLAGLGYVPIAIEEKKEGALSGDLLEAFRRITPQDRIIFSPPARHAHQRGDSADHGARYVRVSVGEPEDPRDPDPGAEGHRGREFVLGGPGPPSQGVRQPLRGHDPGRGGGRRPRRDPGAAGDAGRARGRDARPRQGGRPLPDHRRRRDLHRLRHPRHARHSPVREALRRAQGRSSLSDARSHRDQLRRSELLVPDPGGSAPPRSGSALSSRRSRAGRRSTDSSSRCRSSAD